ncbi:small nuclear ribonucleoprotein Sm D3 [Sorochytrium milnesiophthora]
MSIGVPIKLLHESIGHIVTVELKTGDMYRGKLHEAEDNMNVQLREVVVTKRDGRTTHLEQIFIRGSHCRWFVVPDMLKNAPMFTKIGAKGAGVGMKRGKATVMRAQDASILYIVGDQVAVATRPLAADESEIPQDYSIVLTASEEQCAAPTRKCWTAFDFSHGSQQEIAARVHAHKIADRFCAVYCRDSSILIAPPILHMRGTSPSDMLFVHHRQAHLDLIRLVKRFDPQLLFTAFSTTPIVQPLTRELETRFKHVTRDLERAITAALSTEQPLSTPELANCLRAFNPAQTSNSPFTELVQSTLLDMQARQLVRRGAPSAQGDDYTFGKGTFAYDKRTADPAKIFGPGGLSMQQVHRLINRESSGVPPSGATVQDQWTLSK